MSVKLTELFLGMCSFSVQVVMLPEQLLLSASHLLHFISKRNNLVKLALTAVLGSNLVLSAATNISDQRQLRFAQVVLR